MEINILNPHGFCQGVNRAIDMALKIKNNNKKIYSLGSLIHNKEMIKKLNEHNIITLNDKISRLEMLDNIDNGIVIITAHGVSPDVLEKAKSKNLEIIDATCPYVTMTHSNIEKYLNDGYDVYYIGTKGHPECIGAIGISNKIKLISSLNDIKNIEFKNKSFIINQTTLSIYDIEEYYNEILKKNPNVVINNTICKATTQRQKAVLEANKVDLTIVVGDKLSSNSKKLYELALKKNDAILIETIDDILNYDFSNIKSVNITSGASTPEYLTDEIIEFLRKK